MVLVVGVAVGLEGRVEVGRRDGNKRRTACWLVCQDH